MAEDPRPRIGLIVNPIAGMGGSVGLKGTDGGEVLRQALARGAQPRSAARAARTLAVLRGAAGRCELLAPPAAMGGAVLAQAGIEHRIVGNPVGEHGGGTQSTAADTRAAALAMQQAGASLILFAGGDGTARDLFDALGERLSLIGIPCGVKMYSGLFATSPESAGHLARAYLDGQCETALVEVMDIDEEAYREGRLCAQLHGYAHCPRAGNRLQGPKARGAPAHEQAVRSAAGELARSLRDGTVYLIGPGTSANAVLDALGLAGTLLGVDAVLDGALIGRDLAADAVGRLTRSQPVQLVLGVIGGQGYVLGRGNQQIPAAVIRRAGRDGLLLLSSEEKLAQLAGGRLLVDTGEAALDRELEGFVRVRTGAGRRLLMQLSAGH